MSTCHAWSRRWAIGCWGGVARSEWPRLAHGAPRDAAARLEPARARPTEPVSVRIGLIALVMVAQVALAALAFASPGDPSWTWGIYDDADYDDVVALVTSGTGTVAPAVPAVAPPGPSLIGRLLDGGEPAAPVRSVSTLRPRAPPAA